MNEKKFWKVIKQSRIDESFDNQRTQLTNIVANFTIEDQAKFSWIYGKKWQQAYEDGLLRVAISLMFGVVDGMFYMNDGGYADFADTLVARGEDDYYRILSNPDNLAESKHFLDFGEYFLYTPISNLLEEQGIDEIPVELDRTIQTRAFPEWDDIGFFRANLPRIYQLVSDADPTFWPSQIK